jgi:hypothetical protein
VCCSHRFNVVLLSVLYITMKLTKQLIQWNEFLYGEVIACQMVKKYIAFKESERGGPLFNIPASYSGGPEFKSRRTDRLY